jgi:hypothetical protein
VRSVVEVERELLVRAATVHAATAALVDTLREFDAVDGWQGGGVRSLGHWADINLGFRSADVNRLAGAAARLVELPELRAAFTEGAVSLDKVLAVARVATTDTDVKFTTIARLASVAQLQRICAAYRDVTKDDTPEAHERRRCRRGVTSTSTDDGLVRVVALLDADEAAIVLGALDARAEQAWREERPAPEAPLPEVSTRRADALVELATGGLVEGPDPIVRGERVGVHVLVDEKVLTGERSDGVCLIEGIGTISADTARRLLCDSSVRVNLGRSQRSVSRRQRQALHLRDRGCRFPGCRAHRFVDAHHVTPWERGGCTDLDNLLSLCPAHHRLFHEGHYRIDALGGGRFTFRRPDGRVLAPPPLRAEPDAAPPAPGCPTAQGHGERYDLDLTIDALNS